MEWHSALIEVLDLSLPITSALAAQPHITIDTAWDHPAIKLVRDRLMSFLGQPSTIEQLSAASEVLRARHAELVRKPRLSSAELVQLGVLSSTAYVLSAQALSEASTPQALFRYTITQLTPWLKRAAEVAIIAYQIAKARDLPRDLGDPTAPAAPHGSAEADRELLADLISAHKALSQCLLARMRLP